MSVTYQAVGWNRQKKLYDGMMVGGIALYLAVFCGYTVTRLPEITAETLILRAFGSLALLMLHVVLSIGPLARLDARFLPLLYNRRHLGVVTFLVAAVHGGLALVQFHALGDLGMLQNLLGGVPWLGAPFPFQVLGLVALFILFLMAATSHDFWLAQLTAPWWKALHMLVYAAYALIVLHVALGALQVEDHPLLVALLAAGFGWLAALHLLAATREQRHDAWSGASTDPQGMVELCGVAEIPEKRARIFPVAGERVAVFRYDGQISAISNVCRHQNGPLGEGRIVDGCVVCPWHGYQYRPHDGASPPPFTEKVPTFRVAVRGDRVWLDPRALPAGTPVAPARCEPHVDSAVGQGDFYIGYLPAMTRELATFVRRRTIGVAALAAAVAGLLVAAQRPLVPSTFEYGKTRRYEGLLTTHPHPILWEKDAAGDLRPLLLVAEGKHGADDPLRDFAGQGVSLEGTRIYLAPTTMLEVVAHSVRAPENARPAVEGPPAATALGRHTLRGEIVDGKCHLGVMNPGSGRVHRECAVLCIRGGIPPMFVARQAGRVVFQALLVGESGQPIGAEVLDRVAVPVEAEGALEAWGDLLVYRVSPQRIRPL